MTAILGLGSALFSTIGQGLWHNGGVVLWAIVLLFVEFRRGYRESRADVWVEGACCAFMIATRLTAGLIVVPFLLWVAARDWRRAAQIGAAFCFAYLPWGMAYASTYGSPFGPSVNMLQTTNWRTPAWTPLAGILISPGRGLLVYQPWILLAVAFASRAFRREASALEPGPCPPGWEVFCASAALLFVPLVATWGGWWGGWCWGSRLLSETIPFFGLLCVKPVAALWQSARGRRAVVVLGLVSSLAHVPAIYLDSATWNGDAHVDAHPELLFRWSNPPILYPLLRGVIRS